MVMWLALCALHSPSPCPTLSRSLPRNARPSVGGGGVTVKPPVSTTVWPSGFDTVTSRGPIAAVASRSEAHTSGLESHPDLVSSLLLEKNEALAPAWKFVP